MRRDGVNVWCGRGLGYVLGLGLACVLSLAAAAEAQPEGGGRDRGERPERPGRGDAERRGRFVLPSELSEELRGDLSVRLRSAADRIESGDEVMLVLREELPWMGAAGGLAAERARERGNAGAAEGRWSGQGVDGAPAAGAEQERGRRMLRPLSGDELAAARTAVKERFPALAAWLDVDAEVRVEDGVGDGDGVERVAGAGGNRALEPGGESAWVRTRVLSRAADLVAMAERDADEAEVGFAELGARLTMMRAVRAYGEATRADGGGDPSVEVAAREGVRAALASLFDVRLQEKRLELSRLNERVERLIAETERLEGTRSEFVEKKVEEIARRVRGNGRGGRSGGDPVER